MTPVDPAIAAMFGQEETIWTPTSGNARLQVLQASLAIESDDDVSAEMLAITNQLARRAEAVIDKGKGKAVAGNPDSKSGTATDDDDGADDPAADDDKNADADEDADETIIERDLVRACATMLLRY
jgi:hypothetical protein